MIIRFTIDLPYAIKDECKKELEKFLKKKVGEILNKYGVFEVRVKAWPKGMKEPKEEEEPFEARKYWFEEELEEGKTEI